MGRKDGSEASIGGRSYFEICHERRRLDGSDTLGWPFSKTVSMYSRNVGQGLVVGSAELSWHGT
jgi:hypothetical protein